MNIKSLMDWTEGDLTVSVFRERYGSGFFGVMSSNLQHVVELEDRLTGGDNNWAGVYFPLMDLDWFPIVIAESPEKVIGLLQDKINKLKLSKSNLVDWKYAVSAIYIYLAEHPNEMNLPHIKPGDRIISDFSEESIEQYLR